jgi:RNA polymerase sigma factor (sigma-70 family)
MRTGEIDNVLVMAHQQAVLRTARRLLGRDEDAKDAVQEVFMRLLRGHRSIRGDLGAWLYRVTVNI